ncbi:nitrous oxide reductase accessory protein NosL [Rhodoferax sp.]
MSGESTSRQRTRAFVIAAALSVAALVLVALLLTRPSVTKIGAVPNDICVMAPPQAYDPASAQAMLAARAIPKDARCPVCGMYPARTPQWAAQLIFSNGDAHFFDSPLSLYLYLNAVTRYSPGRSASEIAATYVTDTETGQWTPAGQAFYVHGSTALGPMRNGNLPAFANERAAEQFAQQRGGTVRVAGDITPALLNALDTRPTHSHSMQ